MPPSFTFMLGIGQAQEPVGIETLRPDPTVERFSKRIVRGFARPAEVEHDIVLVIPRLSDQNPWAHFRNPMDMMRHGWSVSLFQA